MQSQQRRAVFHKFLLILKVTRTLVLHPGIRLKTNTYKCVMSSMKRKVTRVKPLKENSFLVRGPRLFHSLPRQSLADWEPLIPGKQFFAFFTGQYCTLNLAKNFSLLQFVWKAVTISQASQHSQLWMLSECQLPPPLTNTEGSLSKPQYLLIRLF